MLPLPLRSSPLTVCLRKGSGLTELIQLVRLPPVQKLLLHTVLFHERGKGECWLSSHTLMAKSGVHSRQTLASHKNALRQLGLLGWRRPGRDGNKHVCCLYRPHWPRLLGLVLEQLAHDASAASALSGPLPAASAQTEPGVASGQTKPGVASAQTEPAMASAARVACAVAEPAALPELPRGAHSLVRAPSMDEAPGQPEAPATASPPAQPEASTALESTPANTERQGEADDAGSVGDPRSFLEAFRSAWAVHYNSPAPRRRDDLDLASTVVDNARVQVSAFLARCQHQEGVRRSFSSLFDDCLAHWITTYLARRGRVTTECPNGYLVGRRHPLSCLVHELEFLPAPWAADELRRHKEEAAAKLAQARADADARSLQAARAKWASHPAVLANPTHPLRWTGRAIPAHEAPSLRVAPVVRLPLPVEPRQPGASASDAYAARVRAALAPHDQTILASLEAIPLAERTCAEKTRVNQLLAKALLMAGE